MYVFLHYCFSCMTAHVLLLLLHSVVADLNFTTLLLFDHDNDMQKNVFMPARKIRIPVSSFVFVPIHWHASVFTRMFAYVCYHLRSIKYICTFCH